MTAADYLPTRLTLDSLREAAKVSAGRIFDEALEEVGIDRSRIYVTNAVKHFKWQPCGKRRIHPSAILRAQDRDTEYAGFVADVQQVVALL